MASRRTRTVRRTVRVPVKTTVRVMTRVRTARTIRRIRWREAPPASAGGVFRL